MSELSQKKRHPILGWEMIPSPNYIFYKLKRSMVVCRFKKDLQLYLAPNCKLFYLFLQNRKILCSLILCRYMYVYVTDLDSH